MSGRLRLDPDGDGWPNRAASRMVASGGLDWHVQMAGAGPVVLLLHGTGASTHSWGQLFPLLAQDFTVVALDLPGHGFTSAPRSGAASLPQMAALVDGLLTQLGLEPVAMVGHSAGAAVALRMVLDTRRRPAVVIGINAALIPFPGLAGRVFPALARALFLNPFAAGLVARRAQDTERVDRLLDNTGSAVPPWSRAIYQRLFANRHHVDATLGMMAKWDLATLWDDLPRVAVPVRLIATDNDRTVPPASADKAVAQMKLGQAIHVPRLGHLAHEENAATLHDWIASILDQTIHQARAS